MSFQPDQPRDNNGQFASYNRGEADGVSLGHMPQGTFRYPPALRDADSVVEFWRNCPVDDEVLEALEEGCMDVQSSRHSAYTQEWLNANPQPDESDQRAFAAWKKGYDEMIDDANYAHPLPFNGDLRDLARLYQMRKVSRPMLRAEERERLDQYQATLPVLEMTDTTDNLLARFGADAVDLDMMMKRNRQPAPAVTQSVSNEKLIQQLAEIQSSLSEMQYQQNEAFFHQNEY